MRSHIRGARELVIAVVHRRLHLIEAVHAVVALELAVVWYDIAWVEPVRTVLQSEEEWILGHVARLTRAAHVGYLGSAHGGGVEALGPIIPAGRLSRVDQGEALGSVCCCGFLVQVDGYVRHARRP